MQPSVLLPTYVFVYGTLRRGESRDINRLQPAPVWVGTAQLPGVLYCLGDYPGMVLLDAAISTTSQLVQGEVYAVTPAIERQLDDIEGILPQPTGEYCKREASVHLSDDGQLLRCTLYEATPPFIAGKPIIASGDWVRFRQSLPGGR